jgi:hypothetical protein
MSLTVALSILGAVVLAALLLHGWWSARRASPRKADAPPPVPQRVEPALGDSLPASAETPAPPAERRAPATRRQARLDALIDAIVPMSLEAPVSGELVLAHWPATRRAGTKPFYIEGLNVDSGDWEQPAPGQRYSELQAGVQLANRSGALNEIEYSEFVHKLQPFVEGVGAMPDFPDMLDVVARARELDALASPLDAQLSIGLRSRGVAWSVSYLQQIATRAGFVPGVLPGRWVLPGASEGEPPMLVLSIDPQAALAEDPQAAAVRECTLSLDVPQTPESAMPFPTLRQMGAQLCEDLDAVAIDDLGEPITAQAFDAIGLELERLYRGLEALDLSAGSPAARRLFS